MYSFPGTSSEVLPLPAVQVKPVGSERFSISVWSPAEGTCTVMSVGTEPNVIFPFSMPNATSVRRAASSSVPVETLYCLPVPLIRILTSPADAAWKGSVHLPVFLS